MRRFLLASVVLSTVVFAPRRASADPAPTWVFFHDKDLRSGAERALDERAASLSPRALSRRRRARGDRGVDERDLAVSPRFIAGVEATGARVRATSRWLDAVSVVADTEQLGVIAGLPYVRALEPVASHARPGTRERVMPFVLPGGAERYGFAAEQLAMLQVPEMHTCGLTGKGVVVAVLDSGFTLDHEALSHIDVLAQHDFVNDDDVTANEVGDPEDQHFHGTAVLSLLAGRAPGTFGGAAPDVTVILAKTESVAFEQPVEEDWFVAGLEWAESLGADLATASLGYIDWYLPSDFDGKTAVTTVAASVAIENGLIMVAAAGNFGPGPTSIGAPADADVLIAVGAVDLAGLVADFSSRGPTADGRIKPDVSAPGVGDWMAVAGTPDAYTQADGTSLAAPLVAGVAALLKQAYPKLTPHQMHALLTGTATQAATPDNAIGYGIVRGYEAAGLYCTCHDADADEAFDAACGGDDCDDGDAAVRPGAAEQCNGVDDDCDQVLMDGEDDADGDGALACQDDCDDADPAVKPGAIEDCDDGIDNDCDGATDAEEVECKGLEPEPEPAAPGSCGCRLHDGERGDGLSLWWLALALTAWVRRRR